jgi:uracil phosphoribosyltransferase
MQEHEKYRKLYIADHPLISHKLTIMRDRNCPVVQFRALLHEISLLMGYEATRNLPVCTRKIETPLSPMEGTEISGRKPAIIPVLRAGLAMSDALLELMPAARVGHIGLYRDHETKRPVEYLVKLPDPAGRHFFVVDPMLATGHSARKALDCLMKYGVSPENCTMIALVGAPEGVEVFREGYPDVPVYLADLDSHLDSNAYIRPGLGDAGDRLFGTK